MIAFLLKGLLRDRHRSLMPFLVVSIGTMLTVVMFCWVHGIIGDMVDLNARYSTGHVKIMSRAYAAHQEQIPNDLALLGVDTLMASLRHDYPDWEWVERIRFGGLVDVPDENRETRAQGPAVGLGVDLLSPATTEIGRLNIREGLVLGRLPQAHGEVLLSDEFAHKLRVQPGDTVTLIGSTMSGSMTMENFEVSGTVRFGAAAMDRGAFLIDLSDARQMLDMTNAAGEILGYDPVGTYRSEAATRLKDGFNGRFAGASDKFAPEAYTLEQQNDLASMLEYIAAVRGIMLGVFIGVMCIVLWNAGLIGGLRRYGEVGLRLAIGENKNHVYRSLLYESVAIGLLGSIAGTAVGLGIAYIMQTVGIDVSESMKSASMMTPGIYRARITPLAYGIGFIPGLLSTVLGTALSGIGIYRRQTASLFKELEA